VVYDAQSGDIEFIEPAVGGKIMAVITVPELRPQVATIRPGTFKYAPAGEKAEVEGIEERIDFPEDQIRCRPISFREDAFDPDLAIADADVIVCVGNGLKDAEQLTRYRELAKLLGGKLGCTRPLFDRARSISTSPDRASPAVVVNRSSTSGSAYIRRGEPCDRHLRPLFSVRNEQQPRTRKFSITERLRHRRRYGRGLRRHDRRPQPELKAVKRDGYTDPRQKRI
jgi:hypothetical protein